jgi:hypothetical protein
LHQPEIVYQPPQTDPIPMRGPRAPAGQDWVRAPVPVRGLLVPGLVELAALVWQASEVLRVRLA